MSNNDEKSNSKRIPTTGEKQVVSNKKDGKKSDHAKENPKSSGTPVYPPFTS